MSQKEISEGTEFLYNPEISIWIDKYDDVFCSFDSRPIAERALSDGFIREVRKMASEKLCDKIEIKFNVLSEESNPESENIIINSLNTHFKNIADVLKKEQSAILRKGYKLMALGSVLIVVLSYISTIHSEESILHGIILMLEPVGWFMTWTGLDHAFQISAKSDDALDFSSKMGEARIAFSSVSETEGAIDKMVIPLDSNNLRVA